MYAMYAQQIRRSRSQLDQVRRQCFSVAVGIQVELWPLCVGVARTADEIVADEWIAALRQQYRQIARQYENIEQLEIDQGAVDDVGMTCIPGSASGNGPAPSGDAKCSFQRVSLNPSR
jgi:hypothetical protein